MGPHELTDSADAPGTVPVPIAARAPCIAALDMGYGHLRAAAALASACGGRVVHADRPPIASEAETRTWRRVKVPYERLSRAVGAWYAPGARRLLELITDIPEPNDGGDLSKPTLGARYLDRMVRGGLGAGLVQRLRTDGDPLVSTFYALAIAADAAGLDNVHVVVTDADVNRVWTPLDPRRSRIRYHVPTDATAARLIRYGVPPAAVEVTGFPLPPELVGGPDRVTLRRNLAARLARLDPTGVFRSARRAEIDRELGFADGPAVDDAPAPVNIVFAVGGAGAQTEIVRRILPALSAALKAGSLRLVLVAGTRPRVAEAFQRFIRASGVGVGVEVLYESVFDEYVRRFNETLGAADVLWTKPSEMTFYAALGLPLVLCPPLGVHERRNGAWALSLGAAIEQGDAAATAARIPSLLADGTLAAAAWAGYRGMPQLGTHRILDRVARG